MQLLRSIKGTIGIWNISLLARTKYTNKKKKNVLETGKKILEENKDEFDPLAEDEAAMIDIAPYALPKKIKSIRAIDYPLAHCHRELRMRKRGN